MFLEHDRDVIIFNYCNFHFSLTTLRFTDTWKIATQKDSRNRDLPVNQIKNPSFDTAIVCSQSVNSCEWFWSYIDMRLGNSFSGLVISGEVFNPLLNDFSYIFLHLHTTLHEEIRRAESIQIKSVSNMNARGRDMNEVQWADTTI